MYYFSLLAAATFIVLSVQTCASPHFYPSQRQDGTDKNQARANAVKEAFSHAWDGYYQYAAPNDELHPVTNNFSNSRNGWAASAVDALSTAILMQESEVVDQILSLVPTIDFDHTDTDVSLFETTIRYLGGLLSGYDLLSGPLSNLASNKTAVDQVLKQAIRLADNLAYAFDTPTGIPSNNLIFANKSTDGSTNNGLATAGTLVLEWTHLSDLTGNQTYAELSQKGESYLLNPKPATSEPWPGLVGYSINIQTGLFEDASGGWSGGTDSFYEYLIKMYAYDPSRFETYKDRWVLAADSSIAHLASHPSSRPDLTFMAEYMGTNLLFESQHLTCFDGGSFILGGLILKEQKYVDFGLELTNGCHNTYTSTQTGIGPEIFRWITNDTAVNETANPLPPPSQKEFYDKNGFYITNSYYALRPEVIESYYYSYRATKDEKYREWAWDAFVAINSTCRTGSGFAELKDVNAKDGGGYGDFQDSFWFAEVLKYSYLIFAPDDEWQVEHEGVNHWVFNTEAHPIPVAGKPV
ncbi:BgTH12-07274 [Blumeria graminis f. sp. triticale]|uniref:mannosyl-oligosaccharide 1,2-alpha-mannosidase n=1 Tax=Blumeria graminis f. sp. triticale TaxID=1689686 RepID=A0A9W4GIY1_BLUGR|nr:BgTH12-07274 [Blumeria graminis f. sp. triticale]